MKRTKSVGVEISGPSSADMRRFRAEEALRTLQRAEEIRSDRGLMADAKRLAAQQARALNKISTKG